ncbi:hypothetical protein ACJ41O_007291 [Fusarium nematophilum]
MAYAQWVYMLIQSKVANGNLLIKNLKLSWGKFYQYDNKDTEVSSSTVGSTTIAPGNSAGIASCGRADAASGTEGSFDLYNGNVKVCNIYWDCPWGKKTNTFTVSAINDDYIVQATGANINSGALGNVTIKVA